MDLNINNYMLHNNIDILNAENHIIDLSKDNTALKSLLDQLSVGDIIYGEITDVINDALTLLTKEGITINARLDNIQDLINIGDTAKFIVKSLENNTISLSFDPDNKVDNNTPAINKALQEATLPLNEKNMTLVKELIDNNLSISKENLQQIVKETYIYKELSVKDIITAHKNNIPLNHGTATQIVAYRDNNHQISKDLSLIKTSINDYNTNHQGNIEVLKDFNIQILDILKDSPKSDNINPKDMAPKEQLEFSKITSEEDIENPSLKSNLIEINELTNLIKNMPDEEVLKLLASDEYEEFLSKAFIKKFTINPKDINKENVTDKYEEISKSLDEIKKTFETNKGNGYQIVNSKSENINNNLDFMKLINNVIHYIQLPLNMSNQNVHGDLYVYKNKRTDEKEDFRLLLHLEMPHLGDTNIHITLNKTSVYTQFFLEDEKSRLLIDKNLPFIKDSINNLGYSFTGEVKESYNKENLFDIIEEDNDESNTLRYSFDIRA